MIVWTRGNNPWTCGGISFDIVGFECDETKKEKFDLGKGFWGYVFSFANGESRLVESISGGIVADSVSDAQDNISDCDDLKFLQNQVKEQAKIGADAKIIPEDKFWEWYWA